MKKLLKLATMGILAASLVGCGQPAADDTTGTNVEQTQDVTTTPATTVITVENGVGENVEIEVPVNPEKVVVLDYVALDMIDSWGLGDKVVGMPKSSTPAHLKSYEADENIVNLGSLKETNMEALMSLQPDIIFTSGRVAAKYDEFSMIAPTVMTAIDYEKGSYTSFKEIATRNAKVFGLEEKVAEQLADFDARVAAIKAQADGKSAVIGIMTGGSFSTLGNTSRCSMITTDLGFTNVATDVDSTHGNASSFELLVQLDPEYIFVLDRDAAISAEGASPAQQLMDNELIAQTQAAQNGNIIYLSPSEWYVTEGGITSMDVMLADVESAFLK